jgi:hypothetical protein
MDKEYHISEKRNSQELARVLAEHGQLLLPTCLCHTYRQSWSGTRTCGCIRPRWSQVVGPKRRRKLPHPEPESRRPPYTGNGAYSMSQRTGERPRQLAILQRSANLDLIP